MKKRKTWIWLLAAVFCISGACITTCCSSNDNPVVEIQQPTIQRITERDKLLVGTTGDYRPLSYRESNGNYWGFGIEMAQKIAERIGVGLEFIPSIRPQLPRHDR